MKNPLILIFALMALMILAIGYTVTSVGSTVTYPDTSRVGGANASQGVRNLVFNFTSTDIAPDANSVAIYGVVQRIVIDADGTDTIFAATLKDSSGVTLFTKADCTTASTPYSYAIYQDDTEGNPHYGVPVCGLLNFTSADPCIVAEVQTLEPCEVATAGPFSLTYGGETTRGVDEVVTLSPVYDPNGGTFKLTFDSQETAALDYDITAAEMKTALEALSSIEPCQVVCTYGPFPDTPIIITFDLGLGNQNVGAITLTDNSLTATDPCDTASITIAVTQAGSGLVYNSSVAVVELALEALSTVDVGDITVGGDTLAAGDMTFTFLTADGDVDLITIDFTYLEGPATCPISETAKGGNQLGNFTATVYYLENAK